MPLKDNTKRQRKNAIKKQLDHAQLVHARLQRMLEKADTVAKKKVLYTRKAYRMAKRIIELELKRIEENMKDADLLAEAIEIEKDIVERFNNIKGFYAVSKPKKVKKVKDNGK